MNHLSLFILIILSSCSIAIKTPSGRFVSPETKGKLFNGDVGIAYTGSTRSNLDTSGVGAGQKISNSMQSERDEGAQLNANIGFLDKLDFFFVNPDRSPNQFGLKYQILGEPELKAKKGNHSLAVTIAYGEETETGVKGDDLFYNSSSSSDGRIESRVRDAAVIYGYRFGENSLGYVGVSYSNYDFDGSFTGGTYDKSYFEYDTDVYGANAGIIGINDDFVLKAELSLQRTKWSYSESQTYGFVGVSCGARWD